MGIRPYLERLLIDEQGAELAEYAVAVALLVAILIVTYQQLGDSIVDQNTGTAAQVTGASWSPP